MRWIEPTERIFSPLSGARGQVGYVGRIESICQSGNQSEPEPLIATGHERNPINLRSPMRFQERSCQ